MFSDFTYSLKELKGPFLDSHYFADSFLLLQEETVTNITLT